MSDFSKVDISSPQQQQRGSAWSWTVTPEIVASVKSEFMKHTTDGFISGAQAKELFIHSKVPINDLALIWALSDRDKDGKLSLEEFVIASVLIFGRKSGVAIPTAMPAELTSSLAVALKPAAPVGAVATPLTRVDSVGKEKIKRQASSTGVGKDKKKKPKSKWAVTPTEKKKYREIFQEKSQAGYISGQQAVSLFTKSKLGRDDLAKIWALADMDRDNQLSQQEFIVAMHLITKRVSGEEIPETVPASLVESASSSTTSKSERKLRTTNSTAAIEPTPAPAQPQVNAVPVLQPSLVGTSNLIISDDTRFAQQPMATSSPMATTTTYSTVSSTSLAQLGVPEKITDSYDPNADMARVSEITDLPALQQLLARVSEEVKNLKLQIERQRLLEETLTERVSFKAQQAQLLERRRQQSERIFQNYSEDVQADEEDLQATQDDIKAVIAELERQQADLKAGNPSEDINFLRQRRRDLTSEANQLKTVFNTNREEYGRLVAELETLRNTETSSSTGALAIPDAASFSDHGFNADFDDKFDFTATNNTSSSGGFEDSFDFGAMSVPRFTMPASGTMTPAHDFDDSTSTHEPDTDWLGQTGLHTPAEPNTDFFGGGSAGFGASDANWADFAGGAVSPSGSDSGRRPRKSAASRKDKGEMKKQSSKKKVKDGSGVISPTTSSKDKKKK